MRMKAVLRFFRDLSISRKLFVYLISFIFIPLVIAAVIINSKTSQIMIDKTQENVFQTFKQTRYNLENMIREMNYLSISIFSDDNIQALIKYYSDQSYSDFERTKNVLQTSWGGGSFQSIFESKPYIDSFSVSRDGDMIYQFGNLVPAEDTRFDITAAELKGKAFWTPLHELRTMNNTSNSVISLIRAVNELESAKQIAVERISIDEGALSNLYSGINTWTGGKMFILDPEGNVLSSPDKSMLGQQLGAEDYVKKIMAEQEGMFPVKIGPTPYILFQYQLADTDWHVVQMVPRKELTGQIGIINLFIFVCITICLLFGIFFSIVQNKSIVQPLKKLVAEMGKVKTGVFDVRLDIASRDEIGRVSATFVSMMGQTKELIDTVYKSELKEREAELKALQSQINPHFLYNTLDSIRWLAIKNKDQPVAEQLEALADLFRHVLSKGGVMTTIGEEIAHLHNYIAIQKNRFGDKIQFILDVESKLLDRKTLKLILQPLVENAIFHGLEQKVGKGTVTVTIRQADGKLYYTVKDDGVGMDMDFVLPMLRDRDESTRMNALRNINDRIKLRFGTAFGLEIESEPHNGTSVQVTMPISTEGERQA